MLARALDLPELSGITVYEVPNLIIGSGAAGLNCAEHLLELGQGCVIVTDRLGAGTSNNSGSDKQTYYKMGVFGDVPDSPLDFARSLFAGGMCHGDLAYCEALGSLPEFFHLVRNGVEFPCNRYGAYVGYKTDHDPRQRATSAGPETSRQMVQYSLRRLRSLGARIFDHHEVIRLLTAGEGDQRRVIGALALNLQRLEAPEMGLTVFWAANTILATGGPGELYADSVYPPGQVGSHGLALQIGAQANNLTESQFGLASLAFRWNLSGTYQQVVPSYFSLDPHTDRQHDFLSDYYPDLNLLQSAIFLKGYQWPCHAQLLQAFGSSLIDLAVYEERAQGRRVYLDFTHNPGGGPWDLTALSPEAADYLQRSGATQPTPYERLQHMNPLAIDLYAQHGIDLRQPLEIAVCAQHCNGGLTVNHWWQTTVPGLFAIGEVAGTHGLRPGGSALNAGQVGGLRVAQYLAAHPLPPPLYSDTLLTAARPQITATIATLRSYLSPAGQAPEVRAVRAEIQRRMSAAAGFIRTPAGAAQALREAREQLRRLQQTGMNIATPDQLPLAVQNDHLCRTQVAFLTALHDLLQRGGGSRGGYVVVDSEGSLQVETAHGPRLPHRPENMAMRREIIEVRFSSDDECEVCVTTPRPLPEDDSWFENTWRDWRAGRIYDL